MSLPFAGVGIGLDTQQDFFFPDRATISTVTSTFDDEGTEVRTPTVLASDVPAQLGVASGGEVRTGEGAFVVREDQIILRGWRPEITETSLIEIGARTFHVRGVLKDSWGIDLADEGWTVCHVEEREP